MSALASLSWRTVRERYDERSDVHDQLLRLHALGSSNDFSARLLGISNGHGD